MAPRAIISYDGTPSDHDALTLGRVFADAGAELLLAYVQHTAVVEPTAGEEDDAQALLGRGARLLGHFEAQRRVVVNASTAAGLERLAWQEDAELIVFGSDYRTPAGHVAPQKTTQLLLEGASVAIAIAPANYLSERAWMFGRIGVMASADDGAALATARDLAGRVGARVTDDEPYVDLLVIGSRAEAPLGRVMLSSAAHNAVEEAVHPVLVLPRGVALRFPLALPA